MSSAEMLDRASRFGESIRIRGDRLKLALDVLAFMYAHHIGTDEAKIRGFSIDQCRQGTRGRVGPSATFPPLETIWKGEHRGGESIGLEILYLGLEDARRLEDTEFGWSNLFSTYLKVWDQIAPDHELLGLVRWIAQIAAGELTEADFKEAG